MNRVTVVDVDAPHNGWKLVLLDILVVIGACLFGGSFMEYLAGGLSFWFVLAALFFWGAASVLEGFLQNNASRRFLVVFLESLALVAFFYTFAWQALAITGVLVLFFLFVGYFAVRRELRNSIEIRFFTASGKVLGKVITAAAIFMVVMYASLMNSNGSIFFSQGGFNTFFNWTAGFVNNFFPSVPLNGSLGDFTQAIARMQLQGTPAFQSLPPAQQNLALTESAGQIAGAFAGSSEATDTAAVASSTMSEPVGNAFYNYLSSFAARLQDKFGPAFVGIWVLIWFLALRSIGIIAVWASQFIALIFYEILLATGFMKISEQSATKEVLEY